MGTVYEAEEGAGGRRVALKLIAQESAGSDEAVERFRREGRLAGLIVHPHCVFVLAADEDAGRPYLVMELMPGDTLKDLVERRGPLPPDEAVAHALDVIAGLQEVHRHGIVHRDVKPSNCFLDHEGRVKVGDFGLARLLAADAHLTRTGTFVGTPLFAAPEQLKGEAVDERSDVYAASGTLYYLLAGRAPHEGRSAPAVAARIASEPPPSLRSLRPEVPPALDRVVLRGLERQPERRYRSLEAFRRALLPFAPAGALSVGGMGRRLIAVLIDAVIVGLPALVLRNLAEKWLRVPGQPLPREHQLVLSALLIALVLLYFGLLEGVWGCSLGKRLLRLRVYRSSRDAPAGLPRALLRTLLFGLLLQLPFEVLDLLPLDCMTRLLVGLLLMTQVPGAFLIILTMRARNGYRGLHEFLSGTRTVQLPWPGKRSRPDPLRAARGVPVLVKGLSRHAQLPATVGPFQVRGALGNGEPAFLVGEDPVLGRDVLLWLRPAGEPPTDARRDVVRLTRLRWLTGGTEDDRRWDAFVAPAGRPVTAVVAAAGPLPWAEVRPLLTQLAEELAAACDDGTLPEVLTLEQVLVRPDGTAELLDAPIGGASAAKAAEIATADGRAQALLIAFAALTLEGRARPPNDGIAPVRQPLPVHAAGLLAALFGLGPLPGYVAEFHRQLAEMRDRPAHATRSARAVHIAVQGVLLVVGLTAAMVSDNLLSPKHWVWVPGVPLILIGVSLAWAFLLRGGPSFPITGLALVRADGRRAARWQAAWRSALVWAQWVIPTTGATVLRGWRAGVPIDPLHVRFEGDEAFGFLAAFALWTVLAVWLPRRTLHDRLAGTYLVPE
jgi:hypothetical protein